MIDPSRYLLFLATAGALVLAPGPGQALVLSRTLAGGRRVGMLTALGLNVGTLFHAAGAALGLSALLARSATAFTAVQLAGAAYLVLLGLRAIGGSSARAATTEPRAPAAGLVFLQAVASGVLNPKVALFFLAFLPQFVEAERGFVFLQFLLLGATMALLDVLYEAGLIWLATGLGKCRTIGARVGRWQERISGFVLVTLGLRLARQTAH
ncbi:MAG: LysE family translocator [Holophagales bacterium]|nr:MAG: LysE family translocator [Holophagales bacterium]